MNYERFLKDHLVKEQKPDPEQIRNQLKRAKKDLITSEAVLSIDITWSFAIAYHAMLRASRALMYSRGYLPTAKDSHKTIIEFTKLILGEQYENLMLRFNRMRRKRHDFIYDAQNHTTSSEAKSAIQTAKQLIDRIISLVREAKTEGGLF
jgi:uncharacterized protein (UPF0332 family)